jgi:branched-chain amino acid transport system substrate-binding protein
MVMMVCLAMGLASPTLAAEDVEIGLFVSLSGPVVDLGTMSRDGAVLAAEDVNNAGGIKALGGAKIKLVIADVTSTPAQGPSVVERTLSTNKVAGIIGYGTSQMTLTCLPVSEKAQVPVITGSVSDKILEQGYKWIFMNPPKGTHIGATQVKFLTFLRSKYSIPIKKVGFIYENTAYGVSTAAGTKETAVKEGFPDIALYEAYDARFTDASPLVTKIKASGVDVLFPVSYTTDAMLILTTMHAMRVRPLVVGGGAGFIWSDIGKSLGDKVNGVFSVAATNWDVKNIMTDPQRKSAVERYKKRFGVYMAEQGVEHYGMVWILKEAIEKAGSTDPRKIREALLAAEFSRGGAGMMQPGKLKFDQTGANTLVHPVMIQWQEGEPRTVYPEEDALRKVIWPVK